MLGAPHLVVLSAELALVLNKASITIYCIFGANLPAQSLVHGPPRGPNSGAPFKKNPGARGHRGGGLERPRRAAPSLPRNKLMVGLAPTLGLWWVWQGPWCALHLLPCDPLAQTWRWPSPRRPPSRTACGRGCAVPAFGLGSHGARGAAPWPRRLGARQALSLSLLRSGRAMELPVPSPTTGALARGSIPYGGSREVDKCARMRRV